MRRGLALGLLLAAACVPGARAPEPLNPVRFLLINDVYVADTLADGQGGLARVATVRNRLADQGRTIFVLAGDVLSPSVLSRYYGGRQMVEALNAAGLDYATFGNHEFELDRDTLVARIAASSFLWLSANCGLADGTPFPKVQPWDTVRVSGHLVGLFGLTLAGSYRGYVSCADPDSAARRAVDTLSAVGADLIVGLTHQTVEADRDLLAREPRLDLILGGHEHEAHDSVVSGRHVLKADANSRSAQFATLWGGKEKWRQAVGLVRIDARLPDDTTVARVVEAWADSLRRRLGPERRLGIAEVPIDARDATSRSRETALGNLVTDAVRAGTGADVALINAGAMRLDDVIPAGPFTNYQVESIFLFADGTRMLRFPVTGARLRELLEHGVSDASLGKGGFLQVSGVRFSYDPSRPSGSRIQGDLRRPDGIAVGSGDTLSVAFAGYPACEGGDGYRVPEARAACLALDQAPRAADLLIRYVTDSLQGRIRPPATGRIAGPESTNPG
ncbi:MAG TPA: bifunctional metallophosphatase/5'-nucleotidase [Gemmatimonadales bacterium]|nr:bifunctional metallophosphatase/5'-nucleotidase [Gemmatimonadales bacterium]